MTRIGGFFACTLSKVFGDGAKVYDYDDNGDFSTLWRLKSSETVCEVNKSIVIIWNGQPRQAGSDDGSLEENNTTTTIEDQADSAHVNGTNLLTAHLTPLDWALAYSICVLGKDTLPDVSIRIVDLTGQDHDEWALRWRHQLLAQMPWVTLYAPLIPTLTSDEPVAYRAGYRPILGEKAEKPLVLCNSSLELFSCATLKSCSSDGTKDALRQLIDAWAATTVRTHDHHDLNNLAGPWILTAQDSGDSHIQAFEQKLKWAGLWSGGYSAETDSSSAFDRTQGNGNSISSNNSTEEHSKSHDDTKSNSPKDACYHVLVIDDMLHLGWDKVILKIFEVTSGGDGQKYSSIQSICNKSSTPHLYGAANPEVLLKALGWREDETLDCDNYVKRCYVSPLCGGEAQPWMLALDLMLFPGRATEEREWLKKLLAIAQAVGDAETLAWPGFEVGELESVEQWLDSSGDTDDRAYEAAMSLFPRLCALRWPAVPILLFSATGRRGVIAKLVENYGNILDTPAKPDLLRGDVGENIATYFRGSRRKIEDVQNLIHVQQRLIKLLSDDLAKSHSVAAVKLAGSGSSDASDTINYEQIEHTKPIGSTPGKPFMHHHLTIALDESGNFGQDAPPDCYSAIGGVIVDVGNANANDAKHMTYEFLEALRAAGVNFYNLPPAYTEICATGKAFRCLRPLTKGHNVNTQIQEVAEGFQQSVRLGAFRCMISKKLYEEGVDADGRYFNPDGTYLKWLARTLELILCEYLPSLGYCRDQTTVSIWLPSRVWTNDQKRQRAVKFDLHSVSQGIAVAVGGYSSAYQMHLRALEHRPDMAKILEKCQLKLRKIPYCNTGDGARPYESSQHWWCGSPHCIIPYTKFKVTTITLGDLLPRCSEKGCNKPLVADYSVAQHLADACLTKDLASFPSSEIETPETKNIDCSISFDVKAGEEMEYFLSAGRSFDEDRMFEGFDTCFRHNWFQGWLEPQNCLTAPIGGRVLMECQEHARNILGTEIESLARLNLW